MATVDASEKTHSSLRCVVSKETGRYGLGMWGCSSALSKSFQDFHCVSFSAGIGTSHSQRSIHSSLTIALPCTVIGATNPSDKYAVDHREDTPTGKWLLLSRDKEGKAVSLKLPVET